MNVARYGSSHHHHHHNKKKETSAHNDSSFTSHPPLNGGSITSSKKSNHELSSSSKILHRPLMKEERSNNNTTNYNTPHLEPHGEIGMDSSSSGDIEESTSNTIIIVEQGEKKVLVFCSIPIICIAVISVFHITVEHAPYFDGDCRGVNCVAGSGEQFAMWTILFILLVYTAAHFIYHFHTKGHRREVSKAQETVWASA
jgi:hypothetical protein